MIKVLSVIFVFLALTGCTTAKSAQPFLKQVPSLAQSHACSRWDQKTLIDAQGHRVIVFICEGTKKDLEPIVFSLNLYGDHTIAGYRSLKEFGSGRIAGSAIAVSTLPGWARSSFSSEEDEIRDNEKFRRFLVDQKILSAQYRVSSVYDRTPASIIFYFSDMKQEAYATQIHENSHVFYNNLESYRDAAARVYASLTSVQKDCVQNFLGQRSMYADGQEVIVDEFIAYYVEEQRKLAACFGLLSPDFNKDGTVAADEQYLWSTHHSAQK